MEMGGLKQNVPILSFPLQRIVLCMLYVTMGLSKMMLRHLCKKANENELFTVVLHGQFATLDIKLAVIEVKKSTA